MENNEIKQGLKSLMDTDSDKINVTSVATAPLKDYVRSKISDIKLLDAEIADMERILRDRVKLRDSRIAEEIEQLRRVTGLNHLQSKVRGLSEAANKELLEE